MKRRATVPEEEQGKKKSAVDSIAARTRSAARAAALTDFVPETFKLTDFADELLVQVYSYLSFKDRQITRGLCQGLLKCVEESTPGADKLSISFLPRERTQRNMPFVIGMQPDSEDPESSVRVEINLLIERWLSRTQAEMSLPKLLSSLPLCSFRPRLLLTGLMQHMTKHQVPRSVKEIDLFYCLFPFEQNPEVQQAFLAFERSSCVQKLILRDSANFFLPTVAQFTRLASLAICPRQNYDADEAELQDLSLLSVHPTLRELTICSDITYINLVTNLAPFKDIQKLDFFCNCNLFRADEEEEEDEAENRFDEEWLFNAFENMIRGMDNLECLGTLHFPSAKFWWRPRENKVMSSRLQELKILFNKDSDSTPEDLAAMVQQLQTFAPSLTTLCLRVEWGMYTIWDDEPAIATLSKLRQHPSLSQLELATEQEIGQEMLSNLQNGLGNKVQVSHVPYDLASTVY